MVQETLLLLCDVVPRTTVNAMLYQWMHQLLYLSFYKNIIKVCTLKNWWWWGIVQCVETFTKNAPHPTPPHPLKTTCTIPGIPCYLRRQGQNVNPLNFGTDPISVLGWQVHVYTPKCMFIPRSAWFLNLVLWVLREILKVLCLSNIIQPMVNQCFRVEKHWFNPIHGI
jgi:hypothetical protein